MENIAPMGNAVAVDAGFAGHAAQARSGVVGEDAGLFPVHAAQE